MAKKKSVKKTSRSSKSSKDDDRKLFAFIATFLGIVGFLVALIAKKDDKYIMFYAKQSLVIFIVFVIAAVISWIPLIGWIIGPLIYIVAVVFWVISWIYALSGEMKDVPIVGDYAKKLNV